MSENQTKYVVWYISPPIPEKDGGRRYYKTKAIAARMIGYACESHESTESKSPFDAFRAVSIMRKIINHETAQDTWENMQGLIVYECPVMPVFGADQELGN